MKLILGLLFFYAVALAQPPRASGVVVVFNIPSGTCAYNAPVYRYGPSNSLYGCILPTYGSLTGTWGLISTGGGSGVTSVGFSTNLGTVSGSPVTTAGTLTNTVAAADIVGLFSTCSGVQYLGADGACHAASTGTVTSVSGSGPSWLTWTIATATTTPAITLAPTTGQTSHQVIGTCNTATTFAPCSLVAGDIPSLPYVPTTRNVNTTSPITGGGDLSADRTIACATCVTSAAALTSNLPVFGAGSQAAAVGTRSGNTTEVATVTGSTPNGNCVKWDASGNAVDSGVVCSSGGGGTGSSITFGACASLPGSIPVSGNEYICTDYPFTYVSDGVNWNAFAFGFAVNPPVLANFTQVNVDHSTLTALTNAGFLWQVTTASSSIHLQVLTTAKGTGNYFVDACFIGIATSSNGGVGSGVSGGTAINSGFAFAALPFGNATFATAGRYDFSSTTAVVNVTGTFQMLIASPLWCTRTQDDGTTNRTFFIGPGPNGPWYQLFQESRTTTFTPANAGLFANPFVSTFLVHMVHYSVHN